MSQTIIIHSSTFTLQQSMSYTDLRNPAFFAASAVKSATPVKSEDYNSFLDQLAQTLIKALVPLQSSSPHPHNHPTSSLPTLHDHHTHDAHGHCLFCSLPAHYVKECLVCQD